MSRSPINILELLYIGKRRFSLIEAAYAAKRENFDFSVACKAMFLLHVFHIVLIFVHLRVF